MRILFIGAGKYQLPGILKAKEMGIYTIAIDGDPNAIGLKKADESAVIDLLNLEKCLEFAKSKQIDGVLTVAADIIVPTVAYISEKLKLPGIKYETALISTNKYKQRERMKNASISCPHFRMIAKEEEIESINSEFSFPIIVKPVDSAGSRGVSYVSNSKLLKEAYLKAKGFSRSGNVIVEEFIQGFEISIEAFSYENQISILALSKKERTSPPNMLDISVTFPADISETIQKKAIEIAKRTINAVGIDFAVVHMEAIVTPTEDVVPVEIAARGPGFKVFTDIIPNVTGIDVLRQLINLSLGKPVNFEKTKNLASTIIFLDSKEGIVKSIKNIEKIRSKSEISEFELYITVGDRTNNLESGSDRVGHIIVYGKSPKETLKIAHDAKNMVEIEVE